jgi:WD40 repeat protein
LTATATQIRLNHGNIEANQVVSPAVLDLAWSPQGHSFVTMHESFNVRIYEANPLSFVTNLTEVQEQVTDFAWSPNGNYLAIADYAANLTLWDMNSLKLVHHLSSRHLIGGLAWDPTNRFLAAFTDHKQILIYNIRTGHLEDTFNVLSTTRNITWSPMENQLAAGGVNEVYILNWRDSSLTLRDIRSVGDIELQSAVWSPDGQFMAVGSDTQVRVYRIANWELVQQFYGQTNGLYYLNWSPDSRYIVGTYPDGIARVWEVQTGEMRYELLHPFNVYEAHWSPDGSILATASDGIYFWHLNLGIEVPAD